LINNCVSDTLHLYILTTVKEDITHLLEKKDGQEVARSDKRLLSIMFKNYRFRKNTHHGLRLSYIGNRVLSKHFGSFPFPLEKSPSNESLIKLDKSMKWPYYISTNFAVFYSENDAAWFKLNGSDLGSFTGYI